MAKKKVTSKKPSTSKKKVEKKKEAKFEEPVIVQNRVQVVPHVKRKTIFNTNRIVDAKSLV